VAQLRNKVSEFSEIKPPQPLTTPDAGSLGYHTAPQPSATDSQPSAEAVITLRDAGGTVTLDKHGALQGLAAIPPSYENLIKDALVKQRLDIPPSLKKLGGEPDTLMGAAKSSAFSLLSPISTVVKGRKPTFHWMPLAGATGYTVTVSDSKRIQVATSSTLTTTSWTSPHSLERGKIYYWQVAAIKEGREIISPSPAEQRARFKVLGPKAWGELSMAEGIYHDSHLILGALYARAGLLDDARREIRELERANPDSAVARALLNSIHTTSPNTH
jgi:hypothetical protein